MSGLSGITRKLVVEHIEIESDDKSKIAVVDHGLDGSATISIRDPWASQYMQGPLKFTISGSDIGVLVAALQGSDATYSRAKDIPLSRIKIEDPTPKTVPNCEPLDIIRAQAVNLAEERELLRLSLIRDHSLDKHISADVEGCETCADKIPPYHTPFTNKVDTAPVYGADRDLPF